MAAQNGRLVVVGAGAVGSSTAYAALIRGSAREVVLYDIDAPKVEAEVLDLAHGTQFTGSSGITGGTDISLAAGADVVVITAGAKQRPGQTRLELAGTNARILESLMPSLLEQAPDAVYILVTNPCDVLTVVAQRIAGLPAGRVFASGTVLDTARLRWMVGERAGVSRSSVHAYIVGEHGDTEFPLWTGATIGGVPLRDWTAADGTRPFTPETLDDLARGVASAAYRVIQGKGATNYAIGLSAARIVEAVLGREDAVLPVSTVLAGQFGIEGVALSLPSVVGAGGVRRVLDIPMDDGELARLAHSAEALRTSAQSLGY
ncbi:L-lactate dehydrogenase [Sinomonas halotolerans]|uniref:L-lactate dehydrogenase n=1 Tax=Sinomonas halotolerans TaxID=1644133 RepID=A0ABU9X3K6_9MICC